MYSRNSLFTLVHDTSFFFKTYIKFFWNLSTPIKLTVPLIISNLMWHMTKNIYEKFSCWKKLCIYSFHVHFFFAYSKIDLNLSLVRCYKASQKSEYKDWWWLSVIVDREIQPRRWNKWGSCRSYGDEDESARPYSWRSTYTHSPQNSRLRTHSLPLSLSLCVCLCVCLSHSNSNISEFYAARKEGFRPLAWKEVGREHRAQQGVSLASFRCHL